MPEAAFYKVEMKYLRILTAAVLAAALITGAATVWAVSSPSGLCSPATHTDSEREDADPEPDGPEAGEVTSGDYVYLMMDEGAVITHYRGMERDVVVPDTLGDLPVAAIDANAFAFNAYLETLSLPDTVGFIGLDAFFQCEHLRQIDHWPAELKGIGLQAFAGCISLEGLRLPEGVLYIGDSAFSGCTSLAEITLPYSLYDIGPSSFAGCTSLLRAVILGDADTGTAQPEYAPFFGCTALHEIIYGGSAELLADLVPPEVRANAVIFSIDADPETETVTILRCIFPAKPYLVLPDQIGGLQVTALGWDAFPQKEVGTVYYLGTSLQWRAVEKGEGNDEVLSRVVCVGRGPGAPALTPVWDVRTDLITGISFADLSGMPLRGIDLQDADWKEPENTRPEETPEPENAEADLPAADEPDDEEQNAWSYNFQSADGKRLNPYDILGTGAVVIREKKEGESEEIGTATLILAGDVTGSGELNIVQLTVMASALTGTRPLEGICLEAADLNGSGELDISDLVLEARWLVNRTEEDSGA